MLPDRIYVVVQGADQRARIADVLRDQFHGVQTCASAQAFLDAIESDARGCAVVPADLEDGGAQRIIDEMHRRDLRIAVVVVGCDDDLRTAVDFVKGGATEFVEHPLRPWRLVRSVRRALADTGSKASG